MGAAQAASLLPWPCSLPCWALGCRSWGAPASGATQLGVGELPAWGSASRAWGAGTRALSPLRSWEVLGYKAEQGFSKTRGATPLLILGGGGTPPALQERPPPFSWVGFAQLLPVWWGRAAVLGESWGWKQQVLGPQTPGWLFWEVSVSCL